MYTFGFCAQHFIIAIAGVRRFETYKLKFKRACVCVFLKLNTNLARIAR